MIYRFHPWANNAALMVDVAKLGYLEGVIIDLTFGEGGFWKKYMPDALVACDLDLAKSPLGYSIDCRRTPFFDKQFNVAVLDLPYRMGGKRDRGTFDERYGTSDYESWQVTYQRIYDGIKECARIASDRILVKAQDAVVSGEVHWQTWDFATYAQSLGFFLEDRFDIVINPRPQRTQKRTRSNCSTLLVLRRGRNYRQRQPVVGHGSSGCSHRDTTNEQDLGDLSPSMGTDSFSERDHS